MVRSVTVAMGQHQTLGSDVVRSAATNNEPDGLVEYLHYLQRTGTIHHEANMPDPSMGSCPSRDVYHHC